MFLQTLIQLNNFYTHVSFVSKFGNYRTFVVLFGILQVDANVLPNSSDLSSKESICLGPCTVLEQMLFEDSETALCTAVKFVLHWIMQGTTGAESWARKQRRVSAACAIFGGFCGLMDCRRVKKTRQNSLSWKIHLISLVMFDQLSSF